MEQTPKRMAGEALVGSAMHAAIYRRGGTIYAETSRETLSVPRSTQSGTSHCRAE
jgi:hypothetical protein